jgi:hypothetical protein
MLCKPIENITYISLSNTVAFSFLHTGNARGQKVKYNENKGKIDSL